MSFYSLPFCYHHVSMLTKPTHQPLWDVATTSLWKKLRVETHHLWTISISNSGRPLRFTPFGPVTSHFPKTRESQARWVQSGSGVSPHRNLSDTKSSRDEDDNKGKHLETRSQALEVTTRTRRLRVSAVSVTPCRQLRGVELKLEVVPPKNKYTGSQIKPRANCSHVNPSLKSLDLWFKSNSQPSGVHTCVLLCLSDCQSQDQQVQEMPLFRTIE